MYTIQSATIDFLRHCRFEKNLSAKTMKAYSIDLGQFLNFIGELKLSPRAAKLEKTHIAAYLERLSKHRPKTIKRKVATLRAMLNYLEFEGKVPVNPMRKMQIRIKEPRQLPRVMDLNEVEKLFGTVYANYRTAKLSGTIGERLCLRDIVVVELLFSLGARVSEIAALRIADIDFETGVVLINGKGSKERLVQICNRKAMQAIRLYRTRLSSYLTQTNSAFLRNRFGRPLSSQSIRGIIRRLANGAGIEKRITPHVFRHTFATLLLENEVDIKYIQTLLGHSSIMTTQIYTHVSSEKQRQILKTKHPRKEISYCISRL